MGVTEKPAEPLPDDYSYTLRARLTDRELISYQAPIGKDGAWVTVSYVTAHAVPA